MTPLGSVLVAAALAAVALLPASPAQAAPPSGPAPWYLRSPLAG